jgi:hypothetical protein
LEIPRHRPLTVGNAVQVGILSLHSFALGKVILSSRGIPEAELRILRSGRTIKSPALPASRQKLFEASAPTQGAGRAFSESFAGNE